MEAGTTVMQPQANECQQPLGAGRGKERIVPESLRMGHSPSFQPGDADPGPLSSRTMREYICVVLSHPVCGNLLQKPRKRMQLLAFHGCPLCTRPFTKYLSTLTHSILALAMRPVPKGTLPGLKSPIHCSLMCRHM